MKLLGLFILLAAGGQIQAQRSEFVEYLLQLQYVVDPIAQYIIDYFAEARAELSIELTELNEEGVIEITSGLRAIIDIRDRTEEAIESSRTATNEACINNAITPWAGFLEDAGDDISTCADVISEVNDLTEELHLYIQGNNYKAFEAQNMVLNLFTELNPLTDTDQLSPTVERQMDEVFLSFDLEVKPYIERFLYDINLLRGLVPSQIYTCVDQAVSRLNERTFLIMEAVEVC